MNFQSFKITENDHGFYFFTISPFEDPEVVMETVEHFVSNSPQIQMCQYLIHCDFDNMKIEKANISCIDIINKNIPNDSKCMNVSSDYVSLIPPPKPKREPKKKAEPKEPKQPKPRGKKAANTKISISTEPQTINMNQ